MNYNTLTKLVSEKEKIVAVFTAKDCALCKEMKPKIDAISHDSRFKELPFVEIDAEEVQGVDLLLKNNETPLVTLYEKGIIKECLHIKTSGDLLAVLKDFV